MCYVQGVMDIRFNGIITLVTPGLNRRMLLPRRPALILLARGTNGVKLIKLQEWWLRSLALATVYCSGKENGWLSVAVLRCSGYSRWQKRRVGPDVWRNAHSSGILPPLHSARYFPYLGALSFTRNVWKFRPVIERNSGKENMPVS
jgi:hypothetical protein